MGFSPGCPAGGGEAHDEQCTRRHRGRRCVEGFFEEIVDGLEAVEPEDHRMVVHELASGSLLIDDCYNANPTSVVAALRTLADLDVSRRIAGAGRDGRG